MPCFQLLRLIGKAIPIHRKNGLRTSKRSFECPAQHNSWSIGVATQRLRGHASRGSVVSRPHVRVPRNDHATIVHLSSRDQDGHHRGH